MTKSEQARADALADAETCLEGLRFASGWYGRCAGRYRRARAVVAEIRWAQRFGDLVKVSVSEPSIQPIDLYAFGANAARAAFRAAPGLRGDR